MIQNVVKIDWTKYEHSIPAFLTMVMMPFTYSIANGLICGLVSYIVIYCNLYLMEKIYPMKVTEKKATTHGGEIRSDPARRSSALKNPLSSEATTKV